VSRAIELDSCPKHKRASFRDIPDGTALRTIVCRDCGDVLGYAAHGVVVTLYRETKTRSHEEDESPFPEVPR
jgi:hypothetical protein